MGILNIKEKVFGLDATQLKFGQQSLNELSWEIKKFKPKIILLVIDPALKKFNINKKIINQIKVTKIQYKIYQQIKIEPSLDSLEAASEFAKKNKFDLIIAVGGGSTIDTAKVINLIKVCKGEVMDYVNQPIGKGKKPNKKLLPLIAIPTTSGSGSEATTVAVLDIPELKLKTGISHTLLRPSLALVDPELSKSSPSGVTASAGLDVICHAIESYISKPYFLRNKPLTPGDRPPYQGSNPISDIWSLQAIEYSGKYFLRSVINAKDLEAKGFMMLSATLAGIGFGSAGVHIPHACAYPIAGLKHSFRAKGYKTAFVPHGISVFLTAPASFRFTYSSNPKKHIKAAELLKGSPIKNPNKESLPKELIRIMKKINTPTGLKDLGYTKKDLPELISGSFKQQRLLALSPKKVQEKDIKNILEQSMKNW
ncbi:iron-containing alcohol dehydrogenase [Pelagibacterales bacterium SAG-MED31]|nr:iron-containing alcohol dehydrogenase [Pelagibacterales bacterium SAG-MED31]